MRLLLLLLLVLLLLLLPGRPSVGNPLAARAATTAGGRRASNLCVIFQDGRCTQVSGPSLYGF